MLYDCNIVDINEVELPVETLQDIASLLKSLLYGHATQMSNKDEIVTKLTLPYIKYRQISQRSSMVDPYSFCDHVTRAQFWTLTLCPEVQCPS